MKLKSTQIKATRETFAASQQSLCAVCGLAFEDNAVLDHNHKTGAVRAAIHRQCNAYLGRIENNAIRHGFGAMHLPTLLRQFADYVELHSTDQTDLVHPTFKTKEEKAALRKARAKRKKP